MQLFTISISKRQYCITLLMLFGLLFSFQSFGQVSISGPTNVSIGTSYTYYPAYNGSSTYSYNGYYSWTISGGVVTGTTNTSQSGTCSSVLYSIGINVTWTSSSGSLYFSSNLGSASLSITAVAALDAGSLSPSSQAINYGSVPTTITGTAATGGASSPSYSYQWQSSPDNTSWTNISGATLLNYSPGNLFATTYYRRQVTENTSYSVAYTASVVVTVYPQLACTISPSTQTISSGATASTLSSSVSGGTGTYTYQWQSSPDNTTWTNVATTANYSPGVLTATKYYRLIVTSNGANITSNTATVTVSSAPTATLSITSTTASGNGSINTLSCAAGGGNGTYTYLWYSSTDGGSSYQLVSGATSSTYTTGVITSTTQFYVAVTSNGYTTNSNVVSITMPAPPTISANSTVLCNGATATLTATGGSGTYIWYNASNTQVGTGTTYTTSTAGTYHAVSSNTYGISGSSNTITISAFTTPVTGPILGNTNCVLGSTAQLSNATTGGTWSTSNSGIVKVDASGIITGVNTGSANITYTVTNACGTSSQQLGITVIPFSTFSTSLGVGIPDPIITDTISLVPNTVKTTQFQQDTLYSSAHSIKNVVALRVIEETNKFIPGDFSATAVVKIEYGHSPIDIYQVDSTSLIVNYTKSSGNKYNAIKYIYFDNAEFTRITVVRVDAPTTVNSVSFDTRQVLLLTNSLMATRYYKLADNKKPVLTYTNPAGGSVPDALPVSWVYPAHTDNNYTQLEWAWVENDLSNSYVNGGIFDTALLFKNGATRIDLAGGATAGSYNIPLLYAGIGKLFIRVRGVNIMPSGSRSDGPWSGVQSFAFNGHSDSLNWQVSTTYAEEGKRKTVIQYYDGSLRSRQTVTKDNTTNTTVVAETLYDGQGRAAVQILPAPGINNIIAYTKNLNKFNNQPDNTNPIDYFDFTTPSLGKYATTPLNETTGTARYYSNLNSELNNTSYNKNIPSANGFAYAVTRYTPDATGRIMMQSGVGDSLQMGSGHATRYYYGSAAQEELDALFGTEVGNYTHYFKNMVQDANGQMSVSYVDMHGRTIATSLAGQAPSSMQPLAITDTSQYKNQVGKIMTRNLLDKSSNILKGNSIESVNTILVPFKTLYSFNYQLSRQTLQLPTCSGGTVSYNCKFDLQISISDESGDTTPIVYNYPGIDTINFQNSVVLSPGSYSVRKTLTINKDSLTKFMQQYDTISVGLCQTQQFLTDSIAALDSTTTGCGLTAPVLTCKTCLDSIGTYDTYKFKYAASIGITDTTQLTSVQKADIRNQYISDSSFCTAINVNTSHTLENIQRQMLADMVPYSGQYARDTGTVSMYYKYNIFSSSGNPLYAQPFYKYPRNRSLNVDNYYDAFGRIDSTVTSAQLSSMSMANFEQAFSYSWANSLLPYHPEFNKLKYAQDNLQPTYNFIDSLNQTVSLAFNPISSDPFFTIISPTADKDSITNYSNVTWQGNYSMWQIAYGDAFGCKTIIDTLNRKNCYANMPKLFTATGTLVNTGSGSVTLSDPIQLQAWNMFKGFYSQVRGDMVNKYISAHTDTTDNQNLINQGFKIYFPTNNVQQSKNAGWTSWYPTQSGTYPAVSLKDSVNSYSSHCDSYINAWRLTLLQCPALASKIPDSLTREQVVASITSRMLTVCKNGTDGANPYGSSTVAPAYAGAAYTSFEQVVNQVFDSLGIPRDLYCNPYGIEFPKPYGKNALITKQYVSGVDTCTCSQFAKLKTEVAGAGYNNTSLTSINQYLWATYKDTISSVLYQGLQQCGQSFLTNCRDTVINTCGHPGAFYSCTIKKCDTLYTLPLLSPQPLPVFLTCGFSSSSFSCYNCTNFKSYDSTFYTIFGRHPVFTGAITNDTAIAYNNLFAQYLNFKTGLQHNWQYYADKFTSAGCPVGGISGSGTSLSICLDNNTPLNDTTGLIPQPSPCQQVHNRAVVKATLVYEAIQQQLIANFQAAYLAKCLSANELFKVTDTLKEYHYTLYYYDQAGNLIKTVPPKGVNPIYRQSFIDSVETAKLNGTQLTPMHSLATRYCYNSLNQVTIQSSPDGGVSKFWYDRLGRLSLSQNAKQSRLGNVYSYTFYDSLGRITQVGQITGGSAMTDATAKNDASLQSWFTGAANTRNQVTQTVYDTAYSPINGIYLSQQNLRNRVSYTQVINNATDVYAASASFYSYDVRGNVDTLLQDFGNSAGIANAMNQTGNRFKKIVYNYDLISGKVNQVSYQPGQADAYYHRYAYDAENRLTDVYTGRDSIMLFLFPEREAHYYYYKHGPLARTELGQLRVQGLDYAYTLQGWLKGINSTSVSDGSYDMGADGKTGSINVNVARDVFGLSLNYFTNDYNAISSATPFAGISTGSNLFNGNIKSMVVNLPTLGQTKVYGFGYDQLNRLVTMDAYEGLNNSTNSFTPITLNDYKERISYDANGNILSYQRNGTGANVNLNNYSYTYINGTNRLSGITNSVNSTTAIYSYDAIGNVIKDDKQNVGSSVWNVYGKLQSVQKTNGVQINYSYGADGNRILKTVNDTTEAYVRDANGNIMAVYKKAGSTGILQQTEINLYGSSQLGIVKGQTIIPQTIVLSGGFGNATVSSFTRGEKEYMLTDHRGNNMATITDRRMQYSAGGLLVDYYLADVKTASYYSSYGAISNSYNGDSIKYAYNGQRRSTEISTTAQTALYWEYNGDVGRRWNVDPKTNVAISPYNCFAGNPIWRIDIKGDTAINPSLGTQGKEYSAWKGMFTPPSEQILKSANDRFNIHDFLLQRLSTASGNELNLDYFPVQINKLPSGFDAGTLFNFIRGRFTSFMQENIAELQPYDGGEAKKWNSDNPLSAIMRFKGYVGNFTTLSIDDADVVTSQYSYSSNKAYWVFTPVEDVSLFFNGDGGHPLAGNREFGIAPNKNGQGYVFYTQGIDRLYGRSDALLRKSGAYNFFENAKQLWITFMNNVATYINEAGGQASFNQNDVISKQINYSKDVSEQDKKAIRNSNF